MHAPLFWSNEGIFFAQNLLIEDLRETVTLMHESCELPKELGIQLRTS